MVPESRSHLLQQSVQMEAHYFPALIYKAVSGDLQESGPQGYDPQEHPCWFASSPNGWTSDELSLSWLQSSFHKQTVNKAERDWRPLVLDGHGSHCTLGFLKWCRSNRILVAAFSPHPTHKLQPLYVSLFGPLALGDEKKKRKRGRPSPKSLERKKV
jgi:hypothetical protein